MKKRIQSLNEYINEYKLNEIGTDKKEIRKNIEDIASKAEKVLKVKLKEVYVGIDDMDEIYGEHIVYGVIIPEIKEDIEEYINLTIYKYDMFEFGYNASPLGFKSTGHTPKETKEMMKFLSGIPKSIDILYKNAKQIREDLLEYYNKEIEEMCY